FKDDKPRSCNVLDDLRVAVKSPKWTLLKKYETFGKVKDHQFIVAVKGKDPEKKKLNDYSKLSRIIKLKLATYVTSFCNNFKLKSNKERCDAVSKALALLQECIDKPIQEQPQQAKTLTEQLIDAAGQKGNLQQVEDLIAKGAIVDQGDAMGATPLMA